MQCGMHAMHHFAVTPSARPPKLAVNHQPSDDAAVEEEASSLIDVGGYHGVLG